MSKIKIVHKVIGERPIQKEVEDNLDEMHKLVGGYVEAVFLPYGVIMWVNEEGLINGSARNFITVKFDKGTPTPVHDIHGDVFFSSSDDEGNTTSLSDIQIKYVDEMFRLQEGYCLVG